MTLKSLITIVLATGFAIHLHAQNIPLNKYGLAVLQDKKQYEQLVKKDSTQQLVNLEQYIPGIKKDVRYATTNNFTHQKLYSSTAIYLRKPAAEKLKQVQAILKKKGYGLLIYDAYRPYRCTELMFKIVSNDLYAADPKKGSGHNRGVAVDLSMVDLKTGKPVAMPTDFDDFTHKAHENYQPSDPTVTANRKLLRDTMKQLGFKGSRTEWWHYYLPDYKKYPLMDIVF
ncbi:D-alanyl-D-alanine dipeptidase [Chitinophaga jiangningensis]|uniref:D-alanyl-D-alanine dipeptidase n=1 Tax=Chitinophaga jiangningensis TaxID=1419482 RepID=A0A1M6V4X7_9BACT|nr:M15 family metallopeptidase [Chitinophaga jiangningensis]SHK76537.1 D-alanyl-D-alanine dipeptidase [Chitinophaga jiangningensis]